MAAKQILTAGLQHTYTIPSALSKDQLLEIGDCWSFMGHIEMQLGLSYSSLEAVRKARDFYRKIRYPLGVSDSYAVEAQAWGQLEKSYRAVISASQALNALDSASKTYRKGLTSTALFKFVPPFGHIQKPGFSQKPGFFKP
ncbi:MAG: hypothetical protein GY749_19810 [Desulfobacteraceae bacterium]|nr:hypothetical protein [Desulfobacteraceae bacterium]